MQNVGLVLLAFAFVLACIAWWRGEINLLSAAVAFWIASELLGGLARVYH